VAPFTLFSDALFAALVLAAVELDCWLAAGSLVMGVMNVVSAGTMKRGLACEGASFPLFACAPAVVATAILSAANAHGMPVLTAMIEASAAAARGTWLTRAGFNFSCLSKAISQ
jgi:hypothetical protein